MRAVKGISTANFRGEYFRPEIKRIDNERADWYIKDPGAQQLTPNCWLIKSRKPYRSSRNYVSTIVMKDKKGFFYFTVPTDKKGQIPEVIIAERLLDVESGDREGRVRNALIDISTKADRVCTPKELATTYEWYLHPNELDIKGIDDPHTKILTLLAKKAGKRPARAIITGGTEAQRQQIAEDLINNFTVAERRIIDNCIISLESARGKYAGCFIGQSDASGKPIGVAKIIIDPKYATNGDVIVHEAIHALRQFDGTRDARLRAVKHYWGKDADLEESLTEAETVTREKPFTKHKEGTGYYHYITIPDKSRGDIVISDRVTLTDKEHQDPKGGKKGKRAQKALLLKYPATYIAHLKIKGNVEAIDSFYEINNTKKDGLPGSGAVEHIQVYNPKGNEATARKMAAEIRSLPATSYEYRDGKKVLLKKAKKVRSRGATRAAATI